MPDVAGFSFFHYRTNFAEIVSASSQGPSTHTGHVITNCLAPTACLILLTCWESVRWPANASPKQRLVLGFRSNYQYARLSKRYLRPVPKFSNNQNWEVFCLQGKKRERGKYGRTGWELKRQLWKQRKRDILKGTLKQSSSSWKWI